MLDQVLRHFPPHTHPLTLASDPDGVLVDEQIRAALGERGFQVIEQMDPIRLRYEVERARPWTVDRPVVMVTAERLDRLPYDLWQQGRHVVLALHTFFPLLDYQVVRSLRPAKRRRLSAAQAGPGSPSEQLSPDGTRRYLARARL